ncbi:MAG: 50S ribosomal protein L21 [Thermoanaerobaculales bacterium]|jgi:large subunit ribosomal protein L21|nr:50S ribosomal protein L21 [Thermoanaerobaculales bacterium]
MADYAVVEHGGKQYRVSPGDVLLVERTVPDLKAGDELRFDRVMMLSQSDAVTVGTPVVAGASVRSQVVAPERGSKVRVFKKKLRKGYRRTNGHRQDYYRVRVEAIEA